MKLTLSGTTYMACFSEIEPESVTPIGFGFRATLSVPEGEYEAWIDRMAEVAADAADDDRWELTRAIYADIERNDNARKAVTA